MSKVVISRMETTVKGWFQTTVKTCLFRALEQYDWLRNGLFVDHGLHYGQDFSSGQLQTWMETMTWLSTWRHFLLREFSKGSSFLGNLSKQLGLQRTPTSDILFFHYFFHLVCHVIARNTMVGTYGLQQRKFLTNWCTSSMQSRLALSIGFSVTWYFVVIVVTFSK